MKRNLEMNLAKIAQLCADEGLLKVESYVTTSAYDGGNLVKLKVEVRVAAPGNPYRFRVEAETEDGERWEGITWRSDTPGEGGCYIMTKRPEAVEELQKELETQK